MNKKLLTFFTALLFSLTALANEPPKDVGKININTASHKELQKNLIGIGDRNATEIIKYREKNGPFKTLEDFDKVRYVGPKLLEKNKDRITFK